MPGIPFWQLVFVNARIFFVGSDDVPADAKIEATRDINQALEGGWQGQSIAEIVSLDQIARAHELVGASRESGTRDCEDYIDLASMAKKKAVNVVLKLTEGEQDLLSQMQAGYQLETDSLGSNPVLRRLKDGDVIRPFSANASTVKALRERRLIHATRGHDPLTIVWRLSKK